MNIPDLVWSGLAVYLMVLAAAMLLIGHFGPKN